MKIELRRRRALVTGGSSGIGKAIALALAEAGARVAITYRTHPAAANAVVRQIRRRRGQALALEADVAKETDVQRVFHELDTAWGGIDILVMNAGMDGERALSWQADFGEWKRVLEVNLFGAFHCAREALQRMVPKRRGVLIAISSVHEQIAWSGYGAYTASKAGLGMLMKTIAQEAAPHGVRALSIAPGAIRTPINRNIWSSRRGLRDLQRKIPLGRMGETEEIARMTVVLASDAASYLTGQTVTIDGGMTDFPDFAKGG